MLKKILLNFLFRLRGEISVKRLKKRGLKIGDNYSVGSGVHIDYSFAHLVEIGKNCTITANVHILAHDASTKKHLGYTKLGKVKIGDNVYIGAGSIILPGVNIGPDSIIGSGSVVSKDIPENVVAAGNPARIICTLGDFLKKHKNGMEIYPCFGEEYTHEKGASPEMLSEVALKMGDDPAYIF